jgi:hypothetical protein
MKRRALTRRYGRSLDTRVKSTEELSQEAEWVARRNRAGQVRHMSGARYMTTVISDRGTELGERTEILKRGKVVSVIYVLPRLP